MKDNNGHIVSDDDVVLCVVSGRQMLIHVKDANNIPKEVKESSTLKIVANARDMPNLIK